MAEDNDQMKARRVELLEDRGETSRFTSAEIDEKGKFTIYTTDIGKMPEEVWGDSDYEFWVTVQAEHKDMLLLALVEKLYGGHFSAVDEFRDFLESKGIPHKFENWA
ncbi:MAG: hypothetical protein NT166_23840 [Candidatus Aminicenantes bacterium]|nr:hypothetical protein [Candidatus Aminicenantes bacterium]